MYIDFLNTHFKLYSFIDPEDLLSSEIPFESLHKS